MAAANNLYNFINKAYPTLIFYKHCVFRVNLSMLMIFLL